MFCLRFATSFSALTLSVVGVDDETGAIAGTGPVKRRRQVTKVGEGKAGIKESTYRCVVLWLMGRVAEADGAFVAG